MATSECESWIRETREKSCYERWQEQMALKVLTSEQRHIYMRRIMKSTVNEGSGTTGRTELTFIDFVSTSWLESYKNLEIREKSAK